MNILSVEQVSRSYGEKQLFENISFGISRGEKFALVGRNGSGKSTLLKILTGQEPPDSGKVAINKDVSLGYLEQEPVYVPGASVGDFLFDLNDPLNALLKEYESLTEKGEFTNRYQTVLEEMDRLRAWDHESRVKQVLGKLEVSGLDRKMEMLSGGERRRVALAKLLLGNHDLLILDEPTNHLDIEMVEWLEGYLTRDDLSLVLVTHDRYFLDRVTDHIIEIDDRTIYHYDGNYGYFLEKKSERAENTKKENERDLNLYRRELEWVRKMPKARGTKSKSRVDSFKRLDEKLSDRTEKTELKLEVKMARLGGKILELEHVSKSFPEKKILEDFSYVFRKGERIGILGKNGTGKSTFLNLITGKQRADSGSIEVGETIVYGYYTQTGLTIKEDKRVIEVIRDIADVVPLAGGSVISASQFLQRFNFSYEMQHQFVSKLSGGEKRRLHLLTVLVKNPNFLILDEPTNDLDLLTLNVLEEFLESFPGCLIIVSHDRYFMDKLIDHLFIFEGDGKVADFPGTYSQYREWKIDKAEELKNKVEKAPVEKKKEEPVKQKLTGKYKHEYEQLEKQISQLEKEKEELERKLSSGLEYAELEEATKKIGELIKLIDEKTTRWIELSEMM